MRKSHTPSRLPVKSGEVQDLIRSLARLSLIDGGLSEADLVKRLKELQLSHEVSPTPRSSQASSSASRNAPVPGRCVFASSVPFWASIREDDSYDSDDYYDEFHNNGIHHIIHKEWLLGAETTPIECDATIIALKHHGGYTEVLEDEFDNDVIRPSDVYPEYEHEDGGVTRWCDKYDCYRYFERDDNRC